jgi:hypothetical protein
VLDFGNIGAGWMATARTMTDYPDMGDMNPRRENLDAVLLPTGEVFVEGGVKNPNDDNSAVKRGESYDPATNTWRVLPEAERPRQYHSVALLMPDGAVWVAGSNFNADTGLANRELRIEIFEPWYFCGRRPSIADAAEQACHGDAFEIRTPDATSIQKVVLVRCSTVTHNFNPDQRHVTLEFRHDKGDILVAQVPSDPAVAIVGYYLLFVIDGTGRPSTGRFIRICPAGRRRRGIDADLWDWLRERMARAQGPDPDDIRRLRRELTEPEVPPRRRLDPPMRPHGEHDHDQPDEPPHHPDHPHDHPHDH